MAEIERTMPFALEAEQSVLGAILLNPEKLPKKVRLNILEHC